MTEIALCGCVVLLLGGCGFDGPPPPRPADAPEEQLYPDAGASCGLSFSEAAAAFPGERVCQTTVYRLDAGYCTHWVACSSL